MVYLMAIAVFFLTPPDTSQLLLISNSIRYGLKRSLFTIAGDLTANCLQMTCAAFGLAAIITTSATAFIWIKWIGVLYLAWIGLQLVFSKDQGDDMEASNSASGLRLFRHGFITSMANPFAVVFFGALFPQFIDPSVPILSQLLILGATYILVDGLLLLLWGWFGVRAADMAKLYSEIYINKICGGLMIAAAALLASKDLEPQK